MSSEPRASEEDVPGGSQSQLATKPAPPIPSSSHEAEAGGSDHEEEPAVAARTTDPNDPYSNLDSAFGGYLQDEPRPLATTNQHQDDLLF
jgi:AP-2 complex subunit beta-1